MASSLEGWHKENFDGASKGNPRPLGCGGVIRNNFGEGMAAFSLHLGIQTNHFAEARAACQSVKMAFEMGIKKLWLEGDSKNIIDCIKCLSQPSWTSKNIIEEPHAILDKFECVHITHVFREANPVADWFANEGFKLDKQVTWHLGRNIREEAKCIIDQEKIQGRMTEI